MLSVPLASKQQRLMRQSYHGLNFSSQIVDNQRKPFIRLTVDHKTQIFGYIIGVLASCTADLDSSCGTR